MEGLPGLGFVAVFLEQALHRPVPAHFSGGGAEFPKSFLGGDLDLHVQMGKSSLSEP